MQNDIKDKIDEREKNKTGLLTRIRRMRGFLHDLQEMDINHLSYWQREMCFTGYCLKMNELLDEAQFILNYLEDKGDAQETIDCLCKNITELEEELYELKND